MKMSIDKIGFILLSLYILQYIAPIELKFLENLQNNSTYRHWSGLALFLLILQQWLLFIYRVVYEMEGKAMEKMKTIHNWVGVLSPLVFFLHSKKPDYGLLFILSVLFFLNLVFGFLNYKKPLIEHFNYLGLLIGAHILFSAAVLTLTLLHIWIVFSYN